ncbi:hypothetical protein [Pontibacter pamirensis]|uniref:hypothetical protein n=1 Tax=Pontibacter pamirensis TaxID=2562824 RepID=UPI001389B241|nr:hypothetical protein [Pontibacter pamirensis]
MSELTEFLTRLTDCDMLVLTLVSTNRLYCRFFLHGLYQDRMFLSDPLLMAELSLLMGEGEVVDAGGIARLKQTFLAV